MRPLLQAGEFDFQITARSAFPFASFIVVVVLAAGAGMPGCSGAGASSAVLPPPPPPLPTVSITVTPTTAAIDRTGLRVLYPDPLDTVHVCMISGRIVPANPLSLPAAPSGVTGVFGSHVVAIDSASGAVIAGTVGGCSCTGAGPARFDGSYQIERRPVGRSYTVYVEPLDGVVVPAQIAPAINTLCRNPASDPGWPALQGCVVPSVNTSFTARVRPRG